MRRKLPDLKSKIAVLPLMQSRYLSRMPCCFASIGACASGKTYLTLSLIKLLRAEKSITKLYIICPTVESNPLFSAVIDPSIDRVYSDLDRAFEALEDVQADCLRESQIWRDKLLYAAALKRFKAGDAVDAAQEALLERFGWAETVEAVRPCPALLLDDCSHSRVFSRSSKNPLTALCLRHRHVGDGTGLSIFMCGQTFTSAIPKAIRLQLTHVAMFRTESSREIKAVYDEVSSFIKYQDFLDIFDETTREKHGYLFCDLVEKTLTGSF